MNFRSTSARLALGGAILAVALLAGSTFQTQAQSAERWIHVRVDNSDDKGEMVRVNLPIALAEILVSSVDHDQLHHGHINIAHADINGVDLRAMLDAVRSAPDGEFVSVKNRDQDVHVSKQNGYLLVRVNDSNGMGNKDRKEVQVRVPIPVVDALLAASKGSNDLDVSAALRALATHGDTDLVNIKDGKQTVHVWLDSKNDGE
jgi:hypothetical protein